MTTAIDVSLARAEHDVVLSDQKLTMEELRVDVLNDAHASLGRLAVSLEALVADNKAMSPIMASGCQAAVTAASGGALPESLVSLESYEGTPEQQTAMSLESVKDTMRKVWEKIKLAVKRAIQAISDFISKLFGGLRKLEKKVSELMTKADAMAKKKIRTDDKMMITNVSRIMLNGTANPKVVEDGIQIVYEELYQATTEYTGVMGVYQKQVETMVTNFNFVDNSTLKEFEENDADVTSQTLKIFKKLTGRTELPGGRALRVKMLDSSEMADGSVHSPKILTAVSVVDHPNVKNPPDKVETKIPSAEWVADRLNEVRAFTKAYSKDKREARVEEYNKMKEGALYKLEKKISEGKSPESADTVKLIRSVLDRVQRDYSASIARLDGYAFRYMRAVVSYLEDCLNALEKATSNSKDVTTA